MPIIEQLIDVIDGGAVSGIDAVMQISGILQNVTVRPLEISPQTYVRIDLYNEAQDKRSNLTEGFASYSNNFKAVRWTGNLEIPEDFSYVLHIKVENLSGTTVRWIASVLFDEKKRSGLFGRVR